MLLLHFVLSAACVKGPDRLSGLSVFTNHLAAVPQKHFTVARPLRIVVLV
jgi:hypothetical protein